MFTGGWNDPQKCRLVRSAHGWDMRQGWSLNLATADRKFYIRTFIVWRFELISYCLVPWIEPKDAVQVEEKLVSPTPGRLVAEPYSWKSLVTGQPILRICTTGTRASVLVLPPGRHVLRFLVQAPHGYHIEMASQTPFVYGDEDSVMVCLTKVFWLMCC